MNNLCTRLEYIIQKSDTIESMATMIHIAVYKITEVAKHGFVFTFNPVC